jgi:hypothetical protein
MPVALSGNQGTVAVRGEGRRGSLFAGVR